MSTYSPTLQELLNGWLHYPTDTQGRAVYADPNHGRRESSLTLWAEDGSGIHCDLRTSWELKVWQAGSDEEANKFGVNGGWYLEIWLQIVVGGHGEEAPLTVNETTKASLNGLDWSPRTPEMPFGGATLYLWRWELHESYLSSDLWIKTEG